MTLAGTVETRQEGRRFADIDVASRNERQHTRLAGLLSLVPAAATGYWLYQNHARIHDGLSRLGDARAGWVVGAALACAAMWIAPAVSLRGAVAEPLRHGPLLAAQFASSCVSHLLPNGVGGPAVTVKHLRCQGLSYAQAVASVGITAVAGFTVHLAFIVSLLVATNARLAMPKIPTTFGWVAGIAVLAIAMLGLLSRTRRWAWTLLMRFGKSLWDPWRTVTRTPRRCALVLLGSAALPLLHGLALDCAMRALGGSLTIATVLTVYLLASTVSAAVPSLGGLGALDAALAIGLHTAGLSLSLAVATVILYRLISVWLPLAPSAITLLVLRRRAWL